MPKGIMGKKIAMTQIYKDTGEAVPVTVIEAGPCVVVQKKTQEKDGYDALKLGFGKQLPYRISKPKRGQFECVKVKPLHFLREIKVNNKELAEYEIGQEVKVDILKEGDYVDVTGISKGKGFAGGIKRHGFHRGPMAHGSKYHRGPGSLAAKGPARVFKGRKLPGRLGGGRVTVKNLEVVKVDPDRNILLLKGAVPGPRKGLLIIESNK